MKYENFDVGGDIVKQDDRYIVKDNTSLDKLIVGSTELFAGQSTTGHKHAHEEIYTFVRGTGVIELDDERFDVKPGDVILIKSNVFHRVHAHLDGDLYFICMFANKRDH